MMHLMIELQKEEAQAIADLPYLSLLLDRDLTVAVQLKFVRETLVLPTDRFTQMPNVHPCLMGLVEHRSNVFWVLDLPQLLGFTPLDSTAIETHIAILQTTNMFLGLGVYRIGRVKRIVDPDIQSPVSQDLPRSIMPFLRGWVADSTDREEPVYILDTEAITKFDFNPITDKP